MTRSLRAANLTALGQEKQETALMRLPTLVGKLQRPLELFTEALFQSNPYQKTPIFRGLFFSGNTSLKEPVFVYDLFTEILPVT